MSDGRTFPTCPRVGVGVVVRSTGGVLLIRRARPPRVGQWSIPGGLVELGEPLERAARREVWEETGVVLDRLQHLTTLDLIEREPSGQVRHHYVLVDFLAFSTAQPPAMNDEVLDAAWCPVDELPGLGLWSETLRIIEMALRADDR